MQDANRIRRIEIRLLQREYDAIVARASAYTSVSHYIRSAISEYSNVNASMRIQQIKLLTEYYQQYHNMLFHMSANVNQAMKRTNELARAGLLNATDITDRLYPVIQQCSDDIAYLRKELQCMTALLCKHSNDRI